MTLIKWEPEIVGDNTIYPVYKLSPVILADGSEWFARMEIGRWRDVDIQNQIVNNNRQITELQDQNISLQSLIW